MSAGGVTVSPEVSYTSPGTPPPNPSVQVSTSASTAKYGEDVTFTANINSSSDVVSFADGSQYFGYAAASNGVAQLHDLEPQRRHPHDHRRVPERVRDRDVLGFRNDHEGRSLGIRGLEHCHCRSTGDPDGNHKPAAPGS